MICTSTLIFLFPSLCLHFHPFISLFLPVCLFLTSSSFMPSFTCFLSYSLDLPAHTNSFKLAFPSFLPHFLLVSALARARAKQPVPASCPYLHVALLSLPLSGIVPMWKGERLWERDTERKARGKEERQGNKGMHADAGPISFTNMQILLPLWYANERLQSAN